MTGTLDPAPPSASAATTATTKTEKHLPNWHYKGVNPVNQQQLQSETRFTFPHLGLEALDLGHYSRKNVSNVDNPATTTSTSGGDDDMGIDKDEKYIGRAYFDMGLRLFLSYQHEMAAQYFLACLAHSPNCALAHGLIALCHAPNYNFKGSPYYGSTCHTEDVLKHDLLCVFPSQQVADRHSKAGVEKVEEIRRLHKQQEEQCLNNDKSSDHGNSDDGGGLPHLISDVEAELLAAIRLLTCCPGVDPDLSVETVGQPFACAMRKLYHKYPHDAEVVYCFVESLMVLNAWQLYEYPSGRPLSDDVEEARLVLETALVEHHGHAGLCHLYVHLSEMSAHPELALPACVPLRSHFPDAGHLVHMGTHIDVLVGDYESCVRYNEKAIAADRHARKFSPSTAGTASFYFGYIVHDYHMLVFGAILGAMEGKAMQAAKELNEMVNETILTELESLAPYLESYSALDIHSMVRFGRWKALLELEIPKNKRLMLYRTASLYYARGLAHAALGNVAEAKKEMDRLNTLRKDPEAEMRILHNNSVANLLAVDAVMLSGEILYREGRHEDAFAMLRQAVEMQDNLNYDEPWGKMQPIRHALGGLLLEQGQLEEAEEVFRHDLKLHPKNPFALVGLIRCLQRSAADNIKGKNCCRCKDSNDEVAELQKQLDESKCEWSDYDVVVACECCQRP